MKRYHIIFAAAAVLLTACREETIDPFIEINGISFANFRTGRELSDSASVTFVYEDADTMDVTVNMQLTGRTTDYDRRIALTLTSDDAREGVDYRIPDEALLKAGATTATFHITLLRTEPLKKADKHLHLSLSENEYFTLPLTFLTNANGDRVTTLEYNIIFGDRFTVKPTTWQDELLGKFSQQKFELICRVLEIHPRDFTDDTKMTLAKQQFICIEMTQYVKDEVAKRDAGLAYDTEVIDRETGLPMIFY